MALGDITKMRAIGVSPIAINATATVYTDSFKLKQGVYFGVYAKAASTGTPTLKIEFQESPFAPATEGAADGNYVVVDGGSDTFSNLNDKLMHVKAFPVVPMTYGRFKITGLATNPADVTLDLGVFIQDIIAG